MVLARTPPGRPRRLHSHDVGLRSAAVLARSRAAGTLLQFANDDEYVARASAVAFRNSLPNRDRTTSMYDGGHALTDRTATADRLAWLAKRLGLAAEQTAPRQNP